jgi:hypothetical protein
VRRSVPKDDETASPILNHPDLAPLPKCLAPTLERLSPAAAPKRQAACQWDCVWAAKRAAALLLHCQERGVHFPAQEALQPEHLASPTSGVFSVPAAYGECPVGFWPFCSRSLSSRWWASTRAARIVDHHERLREFRARSRPAKKTKRSDELETAH